MKFNAFRANRDVLLRGWWLAADGRLYHDVLIEQVLAMTSIKDRERERKKKYREAVKNQKVLEIVSRDTTGTTAGLPWTSTGRDDTGTGTGTGEEAEASCTSLSSETGGACLTATNSQPQVRKRPPPCPHKQIVEQWNRLLPDAQEVVQWTTARAAHLRARWNENDKRQDLNYWEGFFKWIGESEFLMGRKPPTSGRKTFRISLDWLVKEENFAKVVEGQYHGG